jgi:hypothetical protein
MSSGVMKSSMPRSCVLMTISERRLSPNWARIAGQLVDDHLGDPLRARQDVHQVGDPFEQLGVIADDLVALEAGQPLQAQFEDRLRLRFRQQVAVLRQAELGPSPSGRVASSAARASISADRRRGPEAAPSARGARRPASATP